MISFYLVIRLRYHSDRSLSLQCYLLPTLEAYLMLLVVGAETLRDQALGQSDRLP